MTSSFDAAVAGAGFPGHWSWRVEVRARRRTLGLDVLPDGSIVIAVPTAAKADDVAEILRSRRLWLAKAVRNRIELAAEHPAKEVVSGEGLTYLGRHYRLLLVDDQDAPVKLRGGWLKLRRAINDQAGASALINWYRLRGEHWLVERVGSWTGRIGVGRPLVTVGDLGTRWGMRTRDGSVAFHWAVMQLPPNLIDLVVVHELVHLLVSRHDGEFRRRLLLALPDADELATQLGHRGRQVWMGGLRRGG